MTNMTPSQRRMLEMIEGAYAGCGVGEVVREHSCDAMNIDSPLAWRNSDRTLGALLRRGWMRLASEEWCELTDAGRAALARIRSLANGGRR